MNIRINIAIISLLLSSCSSWNKKIISQNDNGNFFIKNENKLCRKIDEKYKKIITLSLKLQNESASMSYNCIVSGRDESDNKLNSVKDILLLEYEQILTIEGFDKNDLDNCFGASAYNFMQDKFISAINNYFELKLSCSNKIYEIFQKSENPKDFKEKFEKFVAEDYKKILNIDNLSKNR